MLKKLNHVIEITGIKHVSIVGGVAANLQLRELAQTLKNDTNKIINFLIKFSLLSETLYFKLPL